MSADMTELKAARFVRAALGLILDEIGTDPGAEGIPAIIHEASEHVGRAIHHLEKAAPPWTAHESYPERPLAWSEVTPADWIKAPNGQWYEVDATARMGEWVNVQFKIGNALKTTKQRAKDKVDVRRGPNGQAIDMFHAAGMTLERIGS